MTPPAACVVCRQLIRGVYFINDWRLPFHRHHATCTACGYPTAELGNEPMCRTCRPTIVSSPEVASARARVVRRQLQLRGILIDPFTARYGLSRRPDPGHPSLGITRTTWLRSAGITSCRVEVAIKRGLPGLLFDAVVAHELTHVWFRIHDVTPPDIVEEGVAELNAYWLLGRAGSRHAAALQHRIATNPDRIYGDGFRTAREAERLHGWPEVAITLLRDGVLPR